MYVSACVCLYLYPCIALGFTSCILWPIIPGFYRSICTRDGFEHEALEKLGHLIAVVHVDGFLMFGSTPAFTDAVAWISADKKNSFLVHNLCIRLGANRKNMDWLTLIRGYRGTLSWAMPFCGPATFSKLRFENSWEKAA